MWISPSKPLKHMVPILSNDPQLSEQLLEHLHSLSFQNHCNVSPGSDVHGFVLRWLNLNKAASKAAQRSKLPKYSLDLNITALQSD
jgi:hypothetical protein